MLLKNLPHLPLLFSVHVTTFLDAHGVYIHPKYLKKGSFGKSISRRSKTSLKYCCFSVSTTNSMNVVLCSVVVSERLKMKKSLLPRSIVMLEISVTFDEFQLVFNFMLFFHFNNIFFNS